MRSQRARYALDDSYLAFHYAVLEPHDSALRDRDPAEVWSTRLRDVFSSQVRGPTFGQQARIWLRRFASNATLPVHDHVGPSLVKTEGVELELDVVVAGAGDVPAERSITAIGEAKAGETMARERR